MSSLIIEVCLVENVSQHPNADLLEILHIKGWQTVARKGEFSVGNKVIFIPPDSILPTDLAERFNVAKYLSPVKNEEGVVIGGRVRVTRLRSIPSYGLIIKVENPDWILGQDLADHYGITKWEPPETCTDGDAEREYHAFHRYFTLENINNFPTLFQDGEEVVMTEKIHGCFTYGMKVLLEDGSSMQIGKIVNNKLQLNVLSYNLETKKIEPKKIINWFDNGPTEDWLDIRIKTLYKGNKPYKIICTPDHPFFCDMKWTTAKNLKCGDKLCRPVLKLNEIQRQMIIGSLLGDGSLYPNDHRNKGFVVGHALKYSDYTDLKVKILGNLHANRFQIESGYGTIMDRINTKCVPDISRLYDLLYINGKKSPNENFLSTITPIALAFWYMDDGSCTHTESQEDRVALATNGFSENEVNLCCEFLKNKFNFSCVPYYSGGWRIRLNTESSQRFFLSIAPYVPSQMMYKLPIKYRGSTWWDKIDFSIFEESLEETEIVSINKAKLNKHQRKSRFNIEIEENNNYFINGFLVHNCNARIGLIKESDAEGNMQWTFMAGSHDVRRKEYQIQKKRKIDPETGEEVEFDVTKRSQFWEIFDIAGVKALLIDMCNTTNNVVVFGELFGSGVQDLAYGYSNGEWDFRVFDITINGKYVDFDVVKTYCDKHKVKMVPTIYRGPFSKENVQECVGGFTTICDPEKAGRFKEREGVVIKTVKERCDANQKKFFDRAALKAINFKYLERKNGTEFH